MRRIPWVIWLLSLSLVCTGRAEIRDTTLVIGENISAFRQIRKVDLKRGVQELVFDGMPNGMDGFGLHVGNQKGRVDLLEWRRLAEPDNSPSRWNVRLDSRMSGEQSLEFIMLCTGLQASVEYDLRLFFSSNVEERVACSFEGNVHILNTTGLELDHVRILLSRSPAEALHTKPASVGFLDLLGEGPLGDFWLKAPVETPLRTLYDLPERISMSAGVSSVIPLVSSRRSRATRLYQNAINPLGDYEESLRLLMQIENEEANDLGRRLPAGAARVYTGRFRSPLLQDAAVAHTEVGDVIGVDLGISEDVHAQRLPVQILSRRLGRVQVRHRIRFTHDLPFSVPVDWRERPDTTLQWQVIRSNADYRLQDRDLLFQISLPSEESRQLEFDLELVQPSL